MRIAGVLLLAVLPAGLLPGLVAQDPASLVADLNHKNRDKSSRAYYSLLRDLPAKALPHLIRELPRFGFTGQNYGMLVLSRYPAKPRRAALRRIAKSKVPFLVLSSAVILFRDGDKKFLSPLVDAIRADNVDVGTRTAMVRRLGGIRHPEVLAVVRELLVPGVHFSVLVAVIDSMWATRDPQGIAAVERLLASKTTRGAARALCAAFLVARDRLAHSAELGKVMSGPGAISWVVWPYLRRARKLEPAALQGLAVHAEKTANVTSLQRALEVLQARDYRHLVRVLRSVANKKNKKLAKVAFQILAEMPDLLKRKELVQMLQSEKPWLALFAIDTLRRRDDDSGLQRALDLVARKDKAMDPHRVEAIRVLGGFRSDLVVQPLIDHLDHAAGGVRSRAYAGVQNVLEDLFPYSRFDFRTTGYQPGAKPAQRLSGIQKIQAWWDNNKK